MSDGESIAGREREVTFHTPGAVTLDERFDRVNILIGRSGLVASDMDELRGHVGALCRTITQQVQELERVKERLHRYNHWTPEHTIEEWLADRQRIVDAKQVAADAQLQARCREMEEERRVSDFMRKRAFEELQKQVAVSTQLQATLAAREARIRELEAYKRSRDDYATNLTDAELRDPEYMQAYCSDFFKDFSAELQSRVKAEAERDAAVQEAGRLQLTWTTARPTVAGNYWVRALMMHAGGFERGSFIVLFDGKVAFIATRNEVIPIEVSSMKDSEWAGPIPLPTEAQQAGGSSGGEANHYGGQR